MKTHWCDVMRASRRLKQKNNIFPKCDLKKAMVETNSLNERMMIFLAGRPAED
jgi:hypothetical protein